MKQEVAVARALAARGAFDEAVTRYSALLDDYKMADKNRASLQHDRGVVYLRMNRLNDALKDFDAAIDLYPTMASALALKADVLRRQGELHRAALALSKALDVRPDQISWRLARASMYLDLERLDEADRDVKTLPSEALARPDSLILLTRLAIAHGEMKEAFSLSQSAAEQFPDDPAVLLVYADRLRHEKKYDEALEVADQLLAVDDRQSKARHIRALCLLALENSQAARDEFTRLIAEDASRASFYADRSLAYLRLGNYPAALADSKTAVDLLPNLQIGHYRKGLVYTHLGQYGAGLASLNQAIRLNADHALSWFARGFLQDTFGYPAAAVEDYAAALALDPDWDLALAMRARIYLAQKKFTAARADIDRALQLSPDFGYAYFLKGRLLEEMGEYREALSFYDKAMRLKGDEHTQMSRASLRMKFGDLNAAATAFVNLHESEMYAVLSRIQYAEILLDQGEDAQALAVVSEAVDLDNASYPARELRVRIALALGDADLALEDLEWLRNEQGQETDYWVQVGDARGILGQHDAALDAYGKALEKFPGNDTAWMGKGRIDLQAGRPVLALEAFQTAIKLQPDLPEGYWGAGQALQSLLVKAGTEVDASPIISSIGDDAQLKETERIEQVLTYYAQAEERGASRAQVLLARVEFYMYLGRFDAAELELVDWLQEHPDDGPAKHLLSRVRERKMDAFNWMNSELNTAPRPPSIDQPVE